MYGVDSFMSNLLYLVCQRIFFLAKKEKNQLIRIQNKTNVDSENEIYCRKFILKNKKLINLLELGVSCDRICSQKSDDIDNNIIIAFSCINVGNKG